jgi:hypothetical protein
MFRQKMESGPLQGPGGAIDDFSNNGGGRYQTRRQYPLGGLLLTSSLASVVAAAEPIGNTPRGPSSMTSTMVVAAVGPIDITFQVPAIDVFFSFGGGHCRTCRQHPLGGPPLTCCNRW